eukprot:TRINITY_DN186_c0_g1_i1.p2 TRINITY_DN186_c0_g1~~TRINITY_DN186_c0_g1_i1.p2  ORF type:complete len:116 (-),score=37.70 TRINITY_DN186_c0_g1_i1:94-441(-)
MAKVQAVARNSITGAEGGIDIEEAECIALEAKNLVKEELNAHQCTHDEVTQKLLNAFKEWDVDNSGHISPDELKEIFGRLDADFTDEEMDAMVKMVDADGNGTISWEEFLLWVTG